MKERTKIALVVPLMLVAALAIWFWSRAEDGVLHIVASCEGTYDSWPACTTLVGLETIASASNLEVAQWTGIINKTLTVLKEGDEVFVVGTAKQQAPRQDSLSLFVRFGVSSSSYVQIHRRNETKTYWTFAEAID